MKNNSNSERIENVEVDFGRVAVFGRYRKTFTIKNPNKEEVFSYRIKRAPEVDVNYQVFGCSKMEGVVKSGEDLKLKMIYTPTMPFQKDTDIFEFAASGGSKVKIVAKGEALGPHLTTSMKSIRFILKPPKKKIKKVFEITNDSDIPADFCFDINDSQEFFQIQPRMGRILKHAYIEVVFSPKSRGIFAQKLTCFVLGHELIVVDLVGLYTDDHIDPKTVIFRPYHPPTTDESFSCMENNTANLPFSMSRTFIDFGRRFQSQPDRGDGGPLVFRRQTASLMNHMKYEIVVEWIDGQDDEVFCVKPQKTKIPPKASGFFEFHFVPPENHNVYNRTFTAQIHWMYDLKTPEGYGTFWNIPLTTSVTLQGNSFSEEDSVISHIEIDPPRVLFPPCLPDDVIEQNFKIRNVGPLPVLYKLVAPYNTNMVLKPVGGLLRDFVIIQAQLRTSGVEPMAFSETWQLVVNGHESKRIPIELSGFSVIPSVKIGKDDCVRLGPAQHNTKAVMKCPLKNNSGLYLRVTIDLEDIDLMHIEPSETFLAPYDEISLTVHYTAHLCASSKMEATYRLQTLRKLREIVGHTFENKFNIYRKCLYSQLCATPNHHDFQLVRWGATIEARFRVFNFGETTVCFRMRCLNRSYIRDTFEIVPCWGEAPPGEGLEVRLSGRARSVGSNEISVVYYNGTAEMEEEPIELYKFVYDCFFPRLQIEEIVEHDFGPLFSKKHLWKFLNMDRLNEVLTNISEGETKKVTLYLPEFEVNSGSRFVTLLVENTTEFETGLELKRKKMCACPLKEVQNTFNTSKLVYHCPHRKVLSVEISETTFCVDSHRLLTITVTYTIPGDTIMAYTMHLGDDRTIELLFHVPAMPENIGKISCYERDFVAAMADVAMDRKVAPIQTCWLYNNTKKSVAYETNLENVEKLCQQEGFEVFRVVNASGEVEPYSAWPFMIKFHPIEIKEHQVPVSLNFGTSSKMLLITGKGRHAKKASQFLIDTTTKKCTATYKMLATLSADFLTVDPLLLWNTTERIVFIKNNTKDRIIQYQWGEAGIRDVVKVTAVNKYGTLLPKESHTVLIKITSFNEACITDIVLPCTLTDYSQTILHRKSLELYERKEREIDGWFTITENGVDYPKNDIVLHDNPKPQTISISIEVNIMHAIDMNIPICSKNLFTCSPQEDIDVNVSEILERCKGSKSDDLLKISENAENIRLVLRQLLSEVVFGKTFEKLLELSANKIPLYYNQFTIDDQLRLNRSPLNNEAIEKLRENQIQNFFSKPTLPVLSETLKELILDGIQESFQLGVSHPQEYDEKVIEKEAETLLQVCSDCSCKLHKK